MSKSSRFKCMYLICLISISFFSSYTFAKNLGVYGDVYPILEKDLLEFIQEKLTKMEEQGEINHILQAWKQKVNQAIDRPNSIELPRTENEHVTIYDPSITLQRDIIDANGRILVKAGDSFNPLNIVNLYKVLVFYDADDNKQVEFVKKLKTKLDSNNTKLKLVLVKGSVVSQIKLFHTAIYFDQKQALINRFNIKHVPAVVKQKGLTLEIRELVP